MFFKASKILFFSLIGSFSAAIGGAVFGGMEMFFHFLNKGDRLIPPPEILIAFGAYFLHYAIIFFIPALCHGTFRVIRGPDSPRWKIAADYFIVALFTALFIYFFVFVNNLSDDDPFSAKNLVMDSLLLIVLLTAWRLSRRGFLAFLERSWIRRSVLLAVIFMNIVFLLFFGLRKPSAALPQDDINLLIPSSLPNVIIMVVDTLRADHLRCYGYERPTSKAIDALMRDSVMFYRCVAQSSWTRPSTTSILTGLYPGTHLCEDTFSSVPEGMKIVPDAMHAYGYRTALISTNGHISQSFGFGNDVDYYAGPSNQASFISSLYQILSMTDKFKKLIPEFNGLPKSTFLYESVFGIKFTPSSDSNKASWVRKNFLNWIDGLDGKPFFAYLHFMEPHHPYRPDPPFNKIFVDPAFKGPIPPTPGLLEKSIPPVQKGQPLPPDQLHELIALYDGEIRDFDHHLRLLIKALKSRHLYESSLIVLTADHGEEFYDHGAWLHAHSLFRELIQVPLIIKLPRNEHAGLKIAGQCSSVDILPTVFDLAGLPIWKGVQGSSLATIIRSEQSTWQGWPAFSEVKLRGVRLKAFLKDQKKLLFIELDKKKYWFLYDLQKDPGEKNSIFESHPEEAKKIMAEMAQFEKKNTEQRFTAKRTRAPDELKENLRELGYIE